jgi:hypothetical protein
MRIVSSGLLLATILAISSCGSSGPASATTPSPTIAIAGAPTLVVGQVAQYTATTTSGQDVTVKSNWTTSDKTTATTTPSGLVSAIATGTVTLTATYQTSFASMRVVVNPSALTPPTIAACGMIVTPGSYVLDADITQPVAAGSCLTITAGGVQLDCHNHTVSGVDVSGAAGGSVSNCVATASSNGVPTGFVVRDSNNVRLDHDIGAGGFVVQDSNNVTLDHDSGAAVTLMRGHDNAVLSNTIDGGYTGSGIANGGDDGILVIDETNDRIDGNTIQNVFDAGVEGVDVVANTTITNNTIVNAADAGIASYWCTSWTGSSVIGNTVSRSTTLVYFKYQVGSRQCPNPSTPGAFTNNLFSGNVFRDPLPINPPDAMWFDFSMLPASSVSNNLIQGNDMGTQLGPYTVPASGFINGGGNTCASPFCGGS